MGSGQGKSLTYVLMGEQTQNVRKSKFKSQCFVQFCEYLLIMTVTNDGQARYAFMISILENKMFSRNKVFPDKKINFKNKSPKDIFS